MSIWNNIMLHDQGLELEYFLQYTLPEKLNLSSSKQVAVRIFFSRFADSVRPLVKKAPTEFALFAKDFSEAFNFIENWRAPSGTYVYFETIDGPCSEILRYTSGKPRYTLYKKPRG